jgi:antirestriction protein ArdC
MRFSLRDPTQLPAACFARPQNVCTTTLWSEAMTKGYSAPIWMTFRQALELNAHVRKGERGSTVVYASTITRNGRDEATGEERRSDSFAARV